MLMTFSHFIIFVDQSTDASHFWQSLFPDPPLPDIAADGPSARLCPLSIGQVIVSLHVSHHLAQFFGVRCWSPDGQRVRHRTGENRPTKCGPLPSARWSLNRLLSHYVALYFPVLFLFSSVLSLSISCLALFAISFPCRSSIKFSTMTSKSVDLLPQCTGSVVHCRRKESSFPALVQWRPEYWYAPVESRARSPLAAAWSPSKIESVSACSLAICY